MHTQHLACALLTLSASATLRLIIVQHAWSLFQLLLYGILKMLHARYHRILPPTRFKHFIPAAGDNDDAICGGFCILRFCWSLSHRACKTDYYLI